MPPFAGTPEQLEGLGQLLGWIEADRPSTGSESTEPRVLAAIRRWIDEAARAPLYGSSALRYVTPGLGPRLAAWFFLAFPTLAIELFWQGKLLGEPLDQPVSKGDIVAGLSPLRRLRSLQHG